MSIIFKDIKLILSDEIKHKINENINKIQDCGDWSKLELGIPLDNFDASENICHESDVWEEVSKVSIGLWNDYEHYRQFTFQSRYKSKIYNDRLKSLGFIYENLLWKNTRKPAIEDVQINVLMHCLCQRLSAQMGLNDEAKQSNEDNERRLENLDSATAQEYEAVQTDGLIQGERKTDITVLDVKCRYCDTNNDIEAVKCSVCETDLIKDDGSFNNYASLPRDSGRRGDNIGNTRINTEVRRESGFSRKEDEDIAARTLPISRTCPSCQGSMRSRDGVCDSCEGVHVEEDTDSDCGQTSGRARGRIKKEVKVSIDSGDKVNSEINKRNVGERGEMSVSNTEVKKPRPSSSRDKDVCVDNIGSRASNTGEGVVASAVVGGKWICSACTFLNNEGTNSCEGCLVDKGGKVLNNEGDRDRPQLKRGGRDKHERVAQINSVIDGGGQGTKIAKNFQLEEPSVNKSVAQINLAKNVCKNGGGQREKGSQFFESLPQAPPTEFTTKDLKYSDMIKKDAAKDCASVRNSDKVSEVWQCPSCTFNNNLESQRCEVCSVEKEGGDLSNNRNRPDNRDKMITKDGGLRYGLKNESVTQINLVKDGAGQGTKIEKNFQLEKPSVNNSVKVGGGSLDDRRERDVDKKVVVDIVGGGRDTGSEAWQCPSCTFNNKLESRCCEVCYTFRDTEVQIEDGETGDVVDNVEEVTETWKCGHCQSDNLLDLYVCAHCHKFAPFFHKWPCERCSFFNTELSPLCAVCGHKNNHLRKCDKCKSNEVYVDKGRTCGPCRDPGPRSHGGDGGSGASSTAGRTASDDKKEDDGLTPTKPRRCAICKNNLRKEEEGVCGKCEARKFYCNNLRCGAINNNWGVYCRKCGLKKGSNVTEYNLVEVHKGDKFMKMWQCAFCGLFNCTKSKCTKCKNLRHMPAYRKCDCNWVNLLSTKKCDKCFRGLR